jgi:hypothetical protein
MRVWRIECPDERVGPWRSLRRQKLMGNEKDVIFPDSTLHSPSDGPRPVDDTGRYMQADDVCVCERLGQLSLWFHDEHMKALDKAGFVLAEYKVDGRRRRGRKGVWQSVFPRAFLTHVSDRAPTDEALT